VPRAVFFDPEPSLIGAVRESPLGELFRPGNHVNDKNGRGNNWAKGPNTKAGHEFC
jgi:tubulin beta